MKKVLTLLAITLSVTTASFAQPGGGERMAQARERMKVYLKDSVGLKDDQLQKYEALQKEYMPKQREIFQDQSLDREAKVAKLKDLNEEKNKKAKDFLTDDQIKKIKEYERGMMRGPGGKRPDQRK
jgi:hypothetical protein